jgi:hypothetical protein
MEVSKTPNIFVFCPLDDYFIFQSPTTLFDQVKRDHQRFLTSYFNAPFKGVSNKFVFNKHLIKHMINTLKEHNLFFHQNFQSLSCLKLSAFVLIITFVNPDMIILHGIKKVSLKKYFVKYLFNFLCFMVILCNMSLIVIRKSLYNCFVITVVYILLLEMCTIAEIQKSCCYSS